jgi:hypothetical protein
MPDLAKIARDYGDNVGFIGLLEDYSTNLNGAIRIMESVNMPSTFFMVDARLPSVSPMLEMVRTGYVPSVAFLHTGEIYGPFAGSYSQEAYSEFLDQLLV